MTDNGFDVTHTQLDIEGYKTETLHLSVDDKLCIERQRKHKRLKHPRERSQISRGCERVQSAPATKSCTPHFPREQIQTLVHKLVNDSEECALLDAISVQKVIYDDWSEAVSGWNPTTPYPNYITQGSHRQKLGSGIKKSKRHGRTAVRYSDTDSPGSSTYSFWKEIVEPVTYRYIPDNGVYQSTKVSKDVQEWLVENKRTLIRKKGKLNPDVKQAQRSLKRDLENHFNKDTVEEKLSLLHESILNPCSSGGAKNISLAFSGNHPVKEQQTENGPGDLLVDNFNSILKALEKELQRQTSPLQSKERIMGKNVLGGAQTLWTVNKKSKEVKGLDTLKTTTHVSSQQHNNNFGDSLFTVTPMSKEEILLGPLEKLTPKQKKINKAQSLQKLSSSGVSLCTEPNIVLASDIQSHMVQPVQVHSAATDSSRTHLSEHAVALTNTDSEKCQTFRALEQTLPFSTELNDTTKSCLSQKGATSSHLMQRGTMRCKSKISNFQLSISDGNLAGAVEVSSKQHIGQVEQLPEILGKRLSVIASTNRLL